MKILQRTAVILLVFIGFYLGAHYWIRWRNTVTDDVTKVSRLVDCDPNEVKAIHWATKEGDKLSFQRIDNQEQGVPSAAQLSFSEWKYLEPKQGEADAVAMVRFASMFCELYDPIPSKEEEFGEPSSAVTKISFHLEGGSDPGDHQLIFGSLGKDRMNVVKYLSPSGKERFVKIPGRLLQLASLKPEEYLNSRVMRMTADNVHLLSAYSGKKEIFTLEREGEGWKVLTGGKEVGAGSQEATKFVNRLSTLRALKVNEEGLNPTACEKSSSQRSVEIAGVGNHKESIFFQFGKTGPLTVCNTAREALFTVHRDMLPYLEVSPKALTAKQ